MGVRAFILQKLRFFTKNRALCVYTDSMGNAYYSQVVGGIERRWVVYGKKVDPSLVPAGCHLWLHYSSNEILPETSRSVHIPNLTGTAQAYHPKKQFPPKSI